MCTPAALESVAASVVAPLIAKLAMQAVDVPFTAELEQLVVIVTSAVWVPVTVTLALAAVPPLRVGVYVVDVVVPDAD